MMSKASLKTYRSGLDEDQGAISHLPPCQLLDGLRRVGEDVRGRELRGGVRLEAIGSIGSIATMYRTPAIIAALYGVDVQPPIPKITAASLTRSPLL